MELDKEHRTEDKIGIKEIHETFWRARDFELTNLWQRSIFLTAFLVLCFTAYGSVLNKILDHITKDNLTFLILNLIGYGLSILGIILSTMWIKMGKGSKAWYEAYEGAIKAIERNDVYTKQKAKKIGGFRYNKMKGYGGIRINNSIFSGSAGEYSVSKLNIGIGQVFYFFWLLIGIGHTLSVAIRLHNIGEYGYLDILSTLAGIVILLAICVVFGSKKIFKSGSLKYYKNKNE